MKKKILKIVLIILILIVIGLIGFLIFEDNSGKKEKNKTNEINGIDIASQCIFTYKTKQFNQFLNKIPDNICIGLNKFKIKDINLNDKKVNVEILYWNDTIYDDDTITGIYINGKRMVPHASPDYFNKIEVHNNMLYIVSSNKKQSNIVIYNASIKEIYNLEKILSENPIEDINTNTKINLSNIVFDTIKFNKNNFTFDVDANLDCKNSKYNISTYKVVYKNGEFQSPQFISSKLCQA